ncbi:putative palmitoyltransferase ZDHHC24 [Nymphon striatum]|nr:putative palmitoyltransferase ZDHHC24 [Nymphon striatum]
MNNDLQLPTTYKDMRIPQNKRDQAYFFCMMFGIPFAVIWEAYVILPNYYNEICTMVILHAVASLFIVFNIFGNMLTLRKTAAHCKQYNLPYVLKPGWRFCYPCSINTPQRSYHCTICNECILKRDHHCAFAGCCVGYQNHRYYFFAVIYTLIGAIYGVYYQWEYVITNIGGLSLWSLPCFIAPHFAWVIGWIPAYSVFVIFLHDIGMVLLFSTAYLFINQVISISRGQTLYEKKHSVEDYNISFSKNWKEVLGDKWHLTWISAFIRSKLPGNGIKFTLASEYETIKNI